MIDSIVFQLKLFIGCSYIVPRDRDTVPSDMVPRDTVPSDMVPRDTVSREHCSKGDIIPRRLFYIVFILCAVSLNHDNHETSSQIFWQMMLTPFTGKCVFRHLRCFIY